MTTEHTQARLAYIERGDDYQRILRDEAGGAIAILYSGFRVQQGDARRLVACWNACQGISTEDLELHYNAGGLDAALDEASLRSQVAVTQQRDALLSALELVLGEFCLDGHGGEFEDGEHPYVDQARAAIASVKGGA